MTAALFFVLAVVFLIASMETLFLTPSWTSWALLLASYGCAAAGGWALHP